MLVTEPFEIQAASKQGAVLVFVTNGMGGSSNEVRIKKRQLAASTSP